MAVTFTRRAFTGSTNGKAIDISTEVASPGVTIHTVGSATGSITSFDEIWLYCSNQGISNHILSIEFGGTATTDIIVQTVPTKDGAHLIIPGISLTATASIIRAFSTTTATGVLQITGHVNHIA